MRRGLAAVLLLPALLVTSVRPTRAQAPDSLASESHLYDRFQISAEGALLNLSTDLKVNSSNGDQGSDVNVENDLGAPKWLVEPAFAFRWRPGKRHELQLEYLFVRRSDETTLSRTIRFADTSFAANLRIGSSTKSDQVSAAYRFAIHAGQRTQFGVGVGVGLLLIREEITAEAAVGSYSASKSLNGPTGSIGLYARFYPGSHLQPHAELRAIRISIDNFTGTVVEGSAALRYFASHTFGGELSYSLGSYSVKLDESPAGGEFLGITFTGKFSYLVQTLRAGVVIAW